VSRRKPSPFQNCETKEAFLVALQQQLASGKLTAQEYGAAKLLCKLKGWGDPAETPEASVAPEVTPSVAPGGDGFWHWREDSKNPWSPPLTTEQMAETYNRVAAEGIAATCAAAVAAGQPPYKYGRYVSVGVLTPKGVNTTICCELPCTVQDLDNLNEEPPRDINDPW
jgi:hypothetical protein